MAKQQPGKEALDEALKRRQAKCAKKSCEFWPLDSTYKALNTKAPGWQPLQAFRVCITCGRMLNMQGRKMANNWLEILMREKG